MCWEKTASGIKNEEELLPCRPTLYCGLYNELPAETEEACAVVGRRTSWGTGGRKNKRCGSSFSSSGRQSEQGSWRSCRIRSHISSSRTGRAAGTESHVAGRGLLCFTRRRKLESKSQQKSSKHVWNRVWAQRCSLRGQRAAAPTASWMFSDHISRLQTDIFHPSLMSAEAK